MSLIPNMKKTNLTVTSKSRIGILGGTFDPIHNGHLNLAQTAYRDFHLDKILVMPTGNPPHKPGQVRTSLEDRITMVKLAIEENSNLEYSNVECERSGYIYSADTMELLKKANPDTEYFFIMGADSLMNITSWHNPEKLFQYTNILAAIRDDVCKSQLEKKILSLKKQYKCKIDFLQAKRFDVSSHQIRKKIFSGELEDLEFLLPEKVYSYIKRKGLYGYRN